MKIFLENLFLKILTKQLEYFFYCLTEREREREEREREREREREEIQLIIARHVPSYLGMIEALDGAAYTILSEGEQRTLLILTLDVHILLTCG